MNPLLFTSFVFIVLFDIYAAVVLVFRLPRVRVDEVPVWLGFWIRCSVVAAFALNWTWLIVAGR